MLYQTIPQLWWIVNWFYVITQDLDPHHTVVYSLPGGARPESLRKNWMPEGASRQELQRSAAPPMGSQRTPFPAAEKIWEDGNDGWKRIPRVKILVESSGYLWINHASLDKQTMLIWVSKIVQGKSFRIGCGIHDQALTNETPRYCSKPGAQVGASVVCLVYLAKEAKMIDWLIDG